MYLKYFLESGIFAQYSKDSESRTLFYFVTNPSGKSLLPMLHIIITCTAVVTYHIQILNQ